MREYGKVSPQFWIGKTGKSLRGNTEAQIVAFYLMTSPHSEMNGVFNCPILYIAHETGLPLEGASKGLQSLIDVDFCTYEEDTDTVFVHEMAKYQIGDDLKPADNRVISVKKYYQNMAESRIKTAFYDRYKDAFHLDDLPVKAKAPSKPLVSQEHKQEQEQENEYAAPQAAKPKQKRAPSKTPLSESFCISERVKAWAVEKGHEFLELHFDHFVSACKRRGYTYADWDEAFMSAVRDNWAKLDPAKAQQAKFEASRPPKPDGDYVWVEDQKRWVHRNFLGVK